MSDFFKPWRRKAGCVTLMTACVFVIGWLRSLVVSDFLQLPGNTRHLGISSGFYGVGIQYSTIDYEEMALDWVTRPTPSAFQFAEGRRQNAENAARIGQVWYWECCGITVDHVGNLRFVRLAYWIAIVPLTLLSAYLLLWPIRRKPATPKPDSVS